MRWGIDTHRLCLFKSCGVATLARNASSAPFTASTGIYHTQAARTLGALVARYAGGSSSGRRRGRYAVPKTRRMREREVWVASTEVSAVEASMRAVSCSWVDGIGWDLGLSFDGGVDFAVPAPRVREKNTRSVSSMGWKTIRATSEPTSSESRLAWLHYHRRRVEDSLQSRDEEHKARRATHHS
jgi:hypothetical protein